MSAGHAGASAGERPETTLGRLGGVAAAVLGGALVVSGLRRRSVGGAAAAALGGWLLYRGLGAGDLRERVSALERVGAGEGETGPTGVRRSHTVTVGRPADELYERWRDPETQTRLFGGFATTSGTDEGRQRWEVDAPFGRRVSWETRVVEDEPGELLRWESIEGAAVSMDGSVRFRPAPADRGTEVTLRFGFDVPGGSVGDAVAERLGVVPETLALKVLRRFKSLAETGEIPTLEKNPSGRGRGDLV